MSKCLEDASNVQYNTSQLYQLCQWWQTLFLWRHFSFRWEEENQIYRQWVEPFLEWGSWQSHFSSSIYHYFDNLKVIPLCCNILQKLTIINKLCHSTYGRSRSYCLFVIKPLVYIFFSQVLEFDLKGIPLDSGSQLDVIVKDYETIGKDK